MGRGQVVRQRFLVPKIVGSNPTAPAKYCIIERLQDTQKGDYSRDLDLTNPYADAQRVRSKSAVHPKLAGQCLRDICGGMIDSTVSKDCIVDECTFKADKIHNFTGVCLKSQAGVDID
jgi:hypothetical protein